MAIVRRATFLTMHHQWRNECLHRECQFCTTSSDDDRRQRIQCVGKEPVSLNKCWSNPIAVVVRKTDKPADANRIVIQRHGPVSSHIHVSSTQYLDSLCFFPLCRFVFVRPFLFPLTGVVLGHFLRVGCALALRILITRLRFGKASSRALHLRAVPSSTSQSFAQPLVIFFLLTTRPLSRACPANLSALFARSWPLRDSQRSSESTKAIPSTTTQLRSSWLKPDFTFFAKASLLMLARTPKAFHALNSALPPPTQITQSIGILASTSFMLEDDP